MSPSRSPKLCPRRTALATLLGLFAFATSLSSSSHTSGTSPSTKHNSIGADLSFLIDENTLYQSSLSFNQVDKRAHKRHRRSSSSATGDLPSNRLIDACQSKVEIVTPYYANNAKGSLRKVVTSELMQQAVQIETCLRSPTAPSAPRCNAESDCGCEQKYKWHRLLVMDPREAGMGKGLFMDWFLFPSSCVCRCKSSSQAANKQFLKIVRRLTASEA